MRHRAGRPRVYDGTALAALERTRDRIPFPLLGIESDNGNEFINDHLLRDCEQEQVTSTRCRPYHTYSITARDLEFRMGYYPMLDRAAHGHNEPGSAPLWIRLLNEYQSAQQ